MGTPVNTQSAATAQSAHQASGADVRTVTPEQLAPSTTQGTISIMTYNRDAIQRGTKGAPDQRGTMLFQNFSLPGDRDALKAALSRLEKGKGNPGDEVRITSGEGEGWADAKAPNQGGLDFLRQALGVQPGHAQTDSPGPKNQARAPQQPEPAPTSPLRVPK